MFLPHRCDSVSKFPTATFQHLHLPLFLRFSNSNHLVQVLLSGHWNLTPCAKNTFPEPLVEPSKGSATRTIILDMQVSQLPQHHPHVVFRLHSTIICRKADKPLKWLLLRVFLHRPQKRIVAALMVPSCQMSHLTCMASGIFFWFLVAECFPRRHPIREGFLGLEMLRSRILGSVGQFLGDSPILASR